MSDIYSGSVYVQIKSPCKKRFPSPLRGLCPLTDPHQGLCSWTQLGATPPDPHYRLALTMGSTTLMKTWVRP